MEHSNSRLENGEAGSQEVAPLLSGTSTDGEGEEQDASSSDDTRVDNSKPGKSSATTSQFGRESYSGQQTPVTRRERVSSFSSGSSGRSLMKTGGNVDLLPTPANGNIKPSRKDGAVTLFPRLWSDTDRNDEDTSGGARGFMIRCRNAVTRAIGSVRHHVSKASQATFSVLPGPLQTFLTKGGSMARKLFWGVWAFMNPPLWAMLAAIVVASIPDLQSFFFTNGTFFKNSVTSAIRQSGGVAVPLILVVLGANLARNTLPVDPSHTNQDDKQETKLLIAALISRMLLPTIIMAPLLAVTAKYVPVSILDDPIFVIVCFLITGAPSALQLAQICQINNVYMGAMSRLLFQSYVVWILPSTLVLVMCALEVVEWAQR